MDRRRLDELVVIQQERDLLGPGDQLVDEGGHDRLQRRRLGPAEQWGEPLANGDPRPVQGRGDIPPEPHRIVVAGVQRQPGDRLPGLARPVAEQARLPEPRRGADQGQLPPRPRGEACQQPGTWQQAGTPLWHIELGGQQDIVVAGRSVLGDPHLVTFRQDQVLTAPW